MPFSTHSDIRLPADLIGLWLRRHYCEDLQRVQSWSRSGYCFVTAVKYIHTKTPSQEIILSFSSSSCFTPRYD